MGYKVGTGSVCQVAKQTTWGTSVAPAALVNMTSESFKISIEKGDEGNLFASKTANQRDLTAIGLDGSVSTILRPEFADWLFECLCGVASTTTPKEYTLQEPNLDLPISTFVISRGGIVKTYPDVTIKSAKLSAAAHDYVKCDIDLVGVKELSVGDTGAQAVDPTITYTKPSYRCTSAVLYYGTEGSSTLTQTLNVENCDITIDNAVEMAPACYDSGFYNERPVMGRRAVTIDFSIPYQESVDTFKKTYYQSETSPSLAMKLKFTTSDTSEKIELYMPHINITSGDANVNGTGVIDSSFSGEVLSIGSDEPITVTITHNP